MRIKMLLLSVAVGAAAALAQTVTVGQMTRIDTPEPAFYPQLSDDGNSVRVTAQNYTGIVSVDLATGDCRTLSTQPKAGRHMTDSQVSVNQDLLMELNRDGQTTVLAPNGTDCRYLWPQLSPDGKRLAYCVSGRGTYVYDLNAQTTAFVGDLRAAKWLDNEFLVAMRDRDNGYEVTESTLLVANADGSFQQAITPESVKAMYPTAAGGRVVFNTAEGQLYMLNVNINR